LLILLFQLDICRADNVLPVKIALRTADLDSHLIHGSLGSTESISQTVSRPVQLFFCRAHGCDRPIDRQTDRQTGDVTPSVT